jgi:23S rRNA (uracil1939-C5)-methyltransferase
MTKTRRRPRVSKVPVTTVVEKLSHDARGIARIDGKTTFIEGALPGEEVTFQYVKKNKEFDEGRTLSVSTPSKDRVLPACPHYSQCGGCSLQHLSASAQVQSKNEQLMDLMHRIGRATPDRRLPPLSDDVWHYRHKARLSVCFIEKNQKVVVGFRERATPKFVTAMTQCLILSEKVEPLIHVLPSFIEQLDARQSIPQIEVAVGDDSVALIFRHLCTLTTDDELRFRTFASTHELLLFLQPGGPQTVHLFHPQGASEYLTYALPSQAVTVLFHPMDFTQINTRLNRRMVTQALELLALTPDDVVLDLFCGIGNFSLALARSCERVIGVEGHATMVARAQMNAKHNQLTNTSFECANLDEEAEVIALKKHQATKVLLDPSRAGALAVVKQMDQLNPETILYVSCDPATLARDSAILIHEKGYRLMATGVMDMFPHTAHLEAMALFQK